MLKHVITRSELRNLPPVTQGFYKPSDPANTNGEDAEYLLSIPPELPGQFQMAQSRFMQQNAEQARARMHAAQQPKTLAQMSGGELRQAMENKAAFGRR
jgi:hypothetical protein